MSPLIDYGHLTSASYEGDSRLLIWTLAWDSHAVLTGTPLFDANIYYPLPHALARAEHHVGLGVFALPLYALSGNAVLTYWILWLLAFPLNAMAMHALAWRVTRDHAASLLAGVVYAFCFFRMHHAHGHIQLLWTWALPLVPLALERWLAQPTWRRAAMVTVLVTIQALSSWYLAVFVAILAAVCAAVMVPGRTLTRAHVVQAVVALAAGALIVGWFARPYFGLAPGPLEEAAANAADVTAYLLPPENTWLGQRLVRHTALQPRWIWGEQTLFIGWSAAALALAAVASLVRGRGPDVASPPILAAVVLTGLLALALSFGPSAIGASPFDLFAQVPGMALLRAPARFALLVMMAVALLVTCGYAAIVRGRSRGVRAGVLCVCIIAFLFESFVVRFPSGTPRPFPPPPVYERLTTLPGGAVASLPSYWGTPEAFREADYLLFSTVHWRPIMNGFGRQEPPDHGSRIDVLRRFPDQDAVELLARIGVRYVVLHTGRASELVDRVEAARRVSSTQLIYSNAGDFLFEIRP